MNYPDPLSEFSFARILVAIKFHAVAGRHVTVYHII
jgi:hypothetical protein